MPRLRPRPVSAAMQSAVDRLDEEVRRRLGPDSTFEEREREAAFVARELLAAFMAERGGEEEPR